MRFMGLDLNLLVAFKAVMDTQSVTGAARQLHLTQPAVSNAVQRLRDYFGDDLFVSQGTRMVPTPLADRLSGPIRSILSESTTMLASARPFDPSSSDRHITLGAPDDVVEAVVSKALNQIFAAAPKLKLDIVPLIPDQWSALSNGDVDMHVLPRSFAMPNQSTKTLYHDRYVVICDKENTAVRPGMTSAELRQLRVAGALVVAPRKGAAAHAPQTAARLVDMASVTVRHFSHLAPILVNSDRIAVVPRQQAIALSKHYPLSYHDMADSLPGLEMVIQIEQNRENDAALQWVAGQLVEQARQIPSMA